MSTRQTARPMTAREELVAQMRAWRKRRRIAFVVQVVTIIAALALAAPAAALLLGQFTGMRDDYVPQRHVPGTDGSISITSADSYVLIRHEAELPPCTITDAEGYELLQEPWRYASDPPTVGTSFYAEPGRYQVACEGGQDGVVALNRDQYINSLRGPWDPRKPALPLFGAALFIYFAGRWSAGRIAPESLRPLYPA
ncbi:hypothetical protein H5392_06815 [Tessaracoccus sp. MC1865]|uniref:hypothetical protein n=1 Tax=Tessaracoccus sp. MC1865 TaxID=2760310 RepID=UPI0016023264|nr:hypothetical protein [Tessaracoccus sp. MC1865]MBB1483571.1 hypothetical protein [Tessaracoccus sp. MC1865]QTO36656.1 hypothetical protein J7D54_09190 [Tessaracoccus sp. MC1865]